MKKILFAIAGVIILSGFITYTSLTQAAGTTSDPNQTGEVKIIDENGVMYLTTETNGKTVYVVNSTPAARMNGPYSINVPSSYAENFGQLISFLLRLVLAVSILLVFGFLISGAFDWITSNGDKGKLEKARGKLVAAVIGLLIVASSYAVMNVVLGFLGFGSLRHAIENVGTIQHGPSPTPETDLGAIINATPSGTPN